MIAGSDQEILTLLADARTSELGFKKLVQLHGKALYAVLFRLMGNHADTDDALQNTYIKAFRHIGAFEGRSSLSTWLHRIAIREGLSLIEKRKRYSSTDPDAAPELQYLKADTALDADKVTALVENAIATLPQKQALVFRLRYYDEQPYEQMSEMLETSVGALKASFHHALKKVEAYLESHNLL